MNEFGNNFGAHNYKFTGIQKIHYDLSLWRNITFVFNVCCIFFVTSTLKWLKCENHKFRNFLVLAKIWYLKLLKIVNQNKF